MDKILVIGSSNTDMVIKTEKMPAPGETILGGTFVHVKEPEAVLAFCLCRKSRETHTGIIPPYLNILLGFRCACIKERKKNE